MSTSTAAPDHLATDALRVQAISQLAFAREQYPDLGRAEASARLDLAAAIIAMDEAEDVPGRHNLQQQLNVNNALHAYGQAIADLIRGESTPTSSHYAGEEQHG